MNGIFRVLSSFWLFVDSFIELFPLQLKLFKQNVRKCLNNSVRANSNWFCGGAYRWGLLLILLCRFTIKKITEIVHYQQQIAQFK